MALTAPIPTSLNADAQSVLKGVVQEISLKHPGVSRILLFGSKARGDFIEGSDIDLPVVLNAPGARKIKRILWTPSMNMK